MLIRVYNIAYIVSAARYRFNTRLIFHGQFMEIKWHAYSIGFILSAMVGQGKVSIDCDVKYKMRWYYGGQDFGPGSFSI